MGAKLSVNNNYTHIEQVDAWLEKNAKALTSSRLVHLFAQAIHSIERRSIATLSSVTVLVIVDRVLHESQEKFPILSHVKVEGQGMKLNGLLKCTENAEELRDALRFILVELLTVLGNITADILTGPLHKELMEVTVESAEVLPDKQTLRAVSATRTNRDQNEN